MKVENPVNGFVRLELDECVLLCDVWLSDGIFDGSWVHYPPLSHPDELLAGATHVFISHIHEDHYDVDALGRVARDAILLIPDVYPNHLMAATLRRLGFQDVRMLKPEAPSEVGPGLSVEVVGRMNAFGQELEHYDQGDLPSMVIDTGVLIRGDDVVIVLLGDNVPYCPEDAGESLERMKQCDLLGFSYNGAASDYPLCYDNLTDAAKRAIANEREDKRELANLALIERIGPKALLPYSSEFALRGPMAKQFALWCGDEWWANKTKAVERYASTTGVPAFALYEGDSLTVTPRGCESDRASSVPPPLIELAEQLYSPIPNPRERFRPVHDAAEIESLLAQAAPHMFDRMDRYGLKSDWRLVLELDDLKGERWCLDLKRRRWARVTSGIEPAFERPTLCCRCEGNYLAALLRGESHWNNAMISFNLHWTREPNVFDRALYDALNFFHVPRPAPSTP